MTDQQAIDVAVRLNTAIVALRAAREALAAADSRSRIADQLAASLRCAENARHECRMVVPALGAVEDN